MEKTKIPFAIADDHTLVRKSIIAMLEEGGAFELAAGASNGAELLQALQALPRPPAVCLLDVNMPQLGGYETLLRLRELYPELRVLILTQLEHEFIVIRMLRAGAAGYMLKTAEPEELKRALLAILEHPYYINDMVNGKLINLVRKGNTQRLLKLSDNEERFLRLCCSDLGYKEIAARMELPERTIAFYRSKLFDMLDVQSRTGLALYALKLGLVPPDEFGAL